MEKQYSVQFFQNFVESLQRLCQDYITYDQMVEVSGYICVEVDNSKKERYVLCELLQSTGNVISESYCTKVFKNCPLPIQRSPSQRRDAPPPQVSPANKRPLGIQQASPRMNRMGQPMNQAGVIRPNNNDRPSSFNQRLNQASSMGAGRGTPSRMTQNYPGGASGPGRGGMVPGQRFSGQAGQVGRPSLAGGMMMNPQQRNSGQRPGMMQRGGPGRPSAGNSMPVRRPFPANQSPRVSGGLSQPLKPASPDNDDELEVISFVPPTRRSIGDSSASSLSSEGRSPMSDTGLMASNRGAVRSGMNPSKSQALQNNPQSRILPVSLVQNVAQQNLPTISRPRQASVEAQLPSPQSLSQPQSNAQSSSDAQMPVPQPSRQQIVQQVLQARANRNQQQPFPSNSHAPPPQPPPPPPPQQQQQQQHTHAAQPQSLPANTPVTPQPQKPPAPVPQQVYQNQNFQQSPHPPSVQTLPNAVWADLSASNYPPGPSKGDQELLKTLNLPGMDTGPTNTTELTSRNASFTENIASKSVAPSSQLGFPTNPLGSLQISNVVSIPQESKKETVTLLPQTPVVVTPPISNPQLGGMDSSFELPDPASDVSDPTSLSFDSKLDDDMPAKKMKMSSDDSNKEPIPPVPIGRKLKELASKKKKRGRPSKGEKGDNSDGEGGSFEYNASVDPSNRSLRSTESVPRRRYEENSDSEGDFPTFNMSYNAGMAGDGEASKDPSGEEGRAATPLQGDTSAGHSTDDTLTEADNESYVLIELESDNEDGATQVFGSAVIIKQELSTFTKPVQFAVNRLTQYMALKKVTEPVYTQMPESLDPLLSEFYLRLRKSNGKEFLANSLKQIQTCIATFMSQNGYPYNLKTASQFEKSRSVIENKIRHLRSREDAIFTLRSDDVNKLFEIGQLGYGSEDSITNTLWLMNTLHFNVRRPKDHIDLRWCDIQLVSQGEHEECLKHIPSNRVVHVNSDNPQRCFISLYKRYRGLRPSTAMNAGANFYLASVNGEGFRPKKYGDYKMAHIFKRMLSMAGMPQEMKISNFDIL